MSKRPALASVTLKRGESQQSLLKRFLKKIKKDNVLEDVFKKGNTRRFSKKSVKERTKRQEAARKRRAEDIKVKKRNRNKALS
jgi:hypothetical protein